jgi:hypothetical protein
MTDERQPVPGVYGPRAKSVDRQLEQVAAALSAFLEPDAVDDWLATGHLMLGGRTAEQAIRGGDLEEVMHAVNATEHGAYN